MGLRIALLMMQKNERLLLDPWITYHKSLVDPGSIFIFDNGSTIPHVVATLAAAEENGINVIRTFNQAKDYYDCGIIFADLIKQLDDSRPHDFYFPMDCDEFMASDSNGILSCNINDIEASLSALIGSDKVLTIPYKLLTSPYHVNRYSKVTWCRKCFFAQDACESLVHGFHDGRSRSGPEQLESAITYFEFHYKPYAEHHRLSEQKVRYLLPNLNRRTLLDYSRTGRSNHHAAVALLQSEYTYMRSFESQQQTIIDTALLQRFAELGIDSTPLFDQGQSRQFLSRFRLLAKHLQLQAGDAATDLYYRLRALASNINRLVGPR